MMCCGGGGRQRECSQLLGYSKKPQCIGIEPRFEPVVHALYKGRGGCGEQQKLRGLSRNFNTEPKKLVAVSINRGGYRRKIATDRNRSTKQELTACGKLHNQYPNWKPAPNPQHSDKYRP
jgi:hypothetical protein